MQLAYICNHHGLSRLNGSCPFGYYPMKHNEDDEDFRVEFNGKEIGNPLLKVVAFLLGILLILAIFLMIGPFLLFIIGIAVFIVVLCVAAALTSAALTVGVLAIPHFILRLFGRNGFFITTHKEEDGHTEASLDIDFSWNAFKKLNKKEGAK